MLLRTKLVAITFLGASALLTGQAPVLAAEETASEYCELIVNHPHPSGHVSGTINVTAVTRCPIPMKSIYIDTELQRLAPNKHTWYNGRGVTRVGAVSATDNQATACSQGPGTFRGWAETKIVPPPGYRLTSSPYDSKWGVAISVGCGSSLTLDAPDSVVVPIYFERVWTKQFQVTGCSRELKCLR